MGIDNFDECIIFFDYYDWDLMVRSVFFVLFFRVRVRDFWCILIFFYDYLKLFLGLCEFSYGWWNGFFFMVCVNFFL